MEIEEFLTVPEENIVYEIPDSEQIVTELAEILKDENSNNLEDADEITVIIASSTALKMYTHSYCNKKIRKIN